MRAREAAKKHPANEMATPGSDQALLQLGALVFAQPEILVQAHWHRFQFPISIPEHAHANLLQLDFNIGMAGTICVNKQTRRIDGVCALAFYPKERHAIDLKPKSSDAEVYSIKIRVPSRLAAVRNRIFPWALDLVVASNALVRSLRQLSRITSVSSARAPLVCATLADVLCHWPVKDGGAVERELSEDVSDEVNRGMQKALWEIDHLLGAPPTLAELARMANMSPRHFTRRFRNLFGCPPHAYIQARRLVHAKELLAHGRLNITEIADSLGFLSIHPFSKWFRKATGMSPSTYREGHLLL